MSDDAMETAVSEKLNDFMRQVLKLGDDVNLDPDKSLVDQVGLDSIEAFDSVATMHELLGVSIPDDFNPKTAETLAGLSRYIISTYGNEVAVRFVNLDLEQLERMRSEYE